MNALTYCFVIGLLGKSTLLAENKEAGECRRQNVETEFGFDLSFKQTNKNTPLNPALSQYLINRKERSKRCQRVARQYSPNIHDLLPYSAKQEKKKFIVGVTDTQKSNIGLHKYAEYM